MTTTTETNGTNNAFVIEARKAMNEFRDGARHVESASAKMSLALYDAIKAEYLPATKDWDGMLQTIEDAAAMVGVVWKGKGKSPNKEIALIRRTWPIACMLRATDAIVTNKGGKRCNTAGELFINADKAKMKQTEKEAERDYIERSVSKCLSFAREFLGAPNNEDKDTIHDLIVSLTKELLDATSVSDAAFAEFNNLGEALKAHRDRRSLAATKRAAAG